jgi:hypothetical protein
MVLVLAALVAWLLPVVAAWIAWRMAWGSYVLLKHGGRTLATVTRVVRGSMVTVTVQYAVGETTYQTETSFSYGSSSIGDSVPVLYPPASPGRGCVAHWQDLWMPPSLWLFVAVVFAIMDIWY